MTGLRDQRRSSDASILEKLERLSAAEDFFAVLDVPYDEARLRVARLHILKRMGEYLKRDDLAALPDCVAAERVKATLQRAYADFERSSPLAERVFRVLKERDPERPATPNRAFVALDAIAPLASSRWTAPPLCHLGEKETPPLMDSPSKGARVLPNALCGRGSE